MQRIICDQLVQDVVAFRGEVAGMQVVAERAYHTDKKPPVGKIKIDIYPLTATKSPYGRTGKVTQAPIYLAVQAARVKPDERDKIDTLVDYVTDLDGWLETHRPVNVTPELDESERFLWLPEYLASQNRFVALLKPEYSWNAKRGPTQS